MARTDHRLDSITRGPLDSITRWRVLQDMEKSSASFYQNWLSHSAFLERCYATAVGADSYSEKAHCTNWGPVSGVEGPAAPGFI
jgi:hypothetical protein